MINKHLNKIFQDDYLDMIKKTFYSYITFYRGILHK